MSLGEAAELSEIPEERIRMYEEGVRRPYGKTLRRLADVYGVRVAELMGPGQVMRSATRVPEVRRRRRRIASRPTEEGSTISVPIEVTEGQTVRLMIELVVRRREDEVVDEGYPGYAADGPRREAPRALPGPGAEESEVAEAAPEPERAGPQRRLRLAEESPRQPRDPILELKRAYSDFRHKKQ